MCPAFDDATSQKRHNDQQRQFSRALAQLLIDGVTFLGEEIGYKQPSVAQALATAFGCFHSVIDMPLVSCF